MKRRLTALLLVLLCLPLTACQKQQNLYSATWFDLFDTVAIVQGYADSQDSWNAQTQAVYSDLQRYNELFDIYHHYDGVINLYDVNARAAAAPVQVEVLQLDDLEGDLDADFGQALLDELVHRRRH